MQVSYALQFTNQPSCFRVSVSKIVRPGEKKQAVPKNGDKPIHGLVSDKNFIVANAVENILAGKYPPTINRWAAAPYSPSQRQLLF